jgi:penicillin-binding protein 1C
LLSFIIFGFFVLLLVAWLWPLPEALRNGTGQLSTRIEDRNGALLYVRQQGGRKEFLPLSNIPHEIRDGLIAVEDRTFSSHHGISIRGIVRALLHDIRAGRVVEGGSTITQQLVRTSLASSNRGLLVKLREAWLALKIDSRFTKDQILEQYLNTAYFGQQAYGVNVAARTYFNKDVSELSLAEDALLLGLLNAPSSLNPFRDIAAAKDRRALVLRAMRETGVIDSEREKEALAEPVYLSHGKTLIRAPHFVLWLLGDRPEEFENNAEVRTTIDLSLQQETERIVENQLAKLSEKNVTSAAVVVLDAENGDILTMVGSADYFDDQHDGAVNVALAPRQPGSAMKPFTYALAFASGMTPATTVADIETRFTTQEGNPYIPRNYDFGYHGLVRLREALANSYNISAIKVLEHVGVPTLLQFLKSVGLTTLTESPEHYGLALTLGDSEVKLLELARAYAIFPHGGRTLGLRTLLTDAVISGQGILDARVAWLIADILSDNDARIAEFGESSSLTFDFPVAAKTGTTRNSRDNWTIGFTPHRIVGVWVGNADNSPMRGTSGVTGAGPIFHDVMLLASRGLPPTPFVRPLGIVDSTICRLSGKLPTALCPARLTEHFIAGTEPKEKDDLYQEISIDRRNNLRAGQTCDPQEVRSETYAVFPPELQKWARENGWKQPPTEFSPLCGGTAGVPPVRQEQWLEITLPRPTASFLLDPLIPIKDQRITFEARADESVRTIEWRVNNVRVGEGIQPDFRFQWDPRPGEFTIQAVSSGQQNSVKIKVEK